MINYEQITLANNLKAYALECNKGSGVVSVNVFYKVGSKNEKLGKSGIAHMLEHLNFKSTKNLKAGEFDSIVKSFGGVNNASTSFDKTHYYIKCSNQNYEKSLELFAELMSNLELKEEEFLPERDVVYEERLLRTDNNPTGYLFFKLYNNAFSYHPYHWTPIGFKNDILNWTIDDIKDFHSTYYQPQNAVVVISGDINSGEVLKKVKNIFENIPNKKDIPSFYQYEDENDEKKLVEVKSKTNIAMLMQGYKIPPFDHEDILALDILSDVLSNLKSSRLDKRLCDELELASECGVFLEDSIDENLFIFFIACNEGVDIEDVKPELDKIIYEFCDSDIKDFELEKVVQNYKLDLKLSLNNAHSLASMFGSYAIRGNIDVLLKQIKNLDKITANDLKNVAKKYFKPHNEICVYMKRRNNG